MVPIDGTNFRLRQQLRKLIGQAEIFLLLITIIFFASNCSPGFDPPYLIQGTRILAIRAEPPEANPGSMVTLTPLVVNPSGEPLTYSWSIYDDISFLIAPATNRKPKGEPIFSYEGEILTFSVPANLLDLLGGIESAYIPIFLEIARKNETYQAFKGILISSNRDNPNRNPKIAGIEVNGSIPSITPILVSPSAPDARSRLFLAVILDSFSIDDGDNISCYWYSEYGEFEFFNGITNVWTAPEEPVLTCILAVVRDGRGGSDWFKIEVEVNLK